MLWGPRGMTSPRHSGIKEDQEEVTASPGGGGAQAQKEPPNSPLDKELTGLGRAAVGDTDVISMGGYRDGECCQLGVGPGPQSSPPSPATPLPPSDA